MIWVTSTISFINWVNKTKSQLFFWKLNSLILLIINIVCKPVGPCIWENSVMIHRKTIAYGWSIKSVTYLALVSNISNNKFAECTCGATGSICCLKKVIIYIKTEQQWPFTLCAVLQCILRSRDFAFLFSFLSNKEETTSCTYGKILGWVQFNKKELLLLTSPHQQWLGQAVYEKQN